MFRSEMYDVALKFTEDEVQHVIEMHTNVSCNSKGLAWIAFPAFHIPLATRGYIGQLNIVFMLVGLSRDFVFQVENCLVMTQLQDVV
ncbi:hypothetical protein D3C85_875020 [compost metagenome]